MSGSGQVPVVHLQLKATFLSSEGPMVESGLGQFTMATVKWRESESVPGHYALEYSDVVILDANSGEPLSNPLAECVLQWEVEGSGKFIRATNVDSVVEYMTQAALAGQGTVDDAEHQVFLEEFLESTRVDSMAATEAHIRELWSNLAGAFAALVRGGTALVEEMNHFGAPCARIERVLELDTRDVGQMVRKKLDSVLEAVGNTSDEFPDPVALRNVVQDLVEIDSVDWTESKEAIAETDSLRPHISNHVRKVLTMFRVFGVPAFEYAVTHTRTFFLWTDIEAMCSPEYIESKYQEFFIRCNQLYVSLLEAYPAIPRVLEARVADGFDLMDTDANGMVGYSELAETVKLVTGSVPSADFMAELVAEIDPAGSDSQGWSPESFEMDYLKFRHFIVSEAGKTQADRSQNLDIALLLDVPISGELSKYGGKAFRKRWQKRIFILDREKSTLSYYAAVTDVKPKGAMDLRDYKRAVINEDPPKGEIFAISLLPRESSDAKQYELAAANQQLRTRWMHLINRAIEQADHVEERASIASTLVNATTRLVSGCIQSSVDAKYKKRFADP